MSWDSEPDQTAEAGAQSAGSEPVVLTTVYDPVEAEMIVAKLRSAGIPSFARHEALSVVIGLTVDGCGQHDILVRPSDLRQARAVLAETG